MTGKKIVLDLDPQGPITFTRAVKIPTGDSKPLEVEFEFLLRDIIQYAELQELWTERSEIKRAAAKADEALPPEKQKKHVEWAEVTLQENAETLMDFIVGWNVDGSEFNAANLKRFVRKYPGSFLTLLRDYRDGMTEGRLGN